jgi:phage terminase large subunit
MSEHEEDLSQAIASVLADLVMRYRDDPVGFMREVLGMAPDAWQEAVLRDIARGERRISIRAGHGVGKSNVCGVATVWHMVTRYPQKTIMTAPTAGQLFDALFAEVKMLIKKLPEPIRELFDTTTDKVTLRAAPEASFVSARTSSADKPEALAGVHSEHVLLICDEASAIPEPVFESAAGSMSGDNACTILISNPTRNTGLFFRTHHQLSSEWRCYHVSSLTSRRVNPDFVKQIIDTYGLDSNQYRIRVLGEFAKSEDDTLIPAELVDAAMVRDVALDEKMPLVYGLDVARFGDDRSVLSRRQGNVVQPMKTWQGLDLMQLVGAVIVEAQMDKPAEICVDTIGMGSGVADRLREVIGELKLPIRVRDVNVSEANAMNPNAAKLRDDLWLQVKDWLNTRVGKLPKDDELRAELVGPRYGFTSNGKLKVEGKPDMKKRGLRSPDKADALALTFASIAASVGGRSPRWVPGQAQRRGLRGTV